MRSFTSLVRGRLLAGALLVLAGAVAVEGAVRAELDPRLEASGGRTSPINVQDPLVLEAGIAAEAGAEDGAPPTDLNFWSAVFDARIGERTAPHPITGRAPHSTGGSEADAMSHKPGAREPSLAIPLPSPLLAAAVLAVVAELSRRRMARRRQ